MNAIEKPFRFLWKNHLDFFVRNIIFFYVYFVGTSYIMSNMFFDNLVRNLIKYKGKLIDGEKVGTLLKSSMGDDFSVQKMYKMIYYLKVR